MFLRQFIETTIPTKKFSKGELIYRHGANAKYFYEVKKGEVAIVCSNDEGKEFMQGLYATGDCFGADALICNKVYSSAAIACSASEMNVITKEKFFKLLKDNYEFHFNITKMLCGQLQYKTMMLEELAMEGGEHRLLTLIQYLTTNKSNAGRAIDTTKQRLAAMTGLRVETVIRILKRIEKKGMIASERGKIIHLRMNDEKYVL